MTDHDVLFKSQIHYYIKQRYYRIALNMAIEAMRIYPSDPKFRLYYAIALYQEARYQESIRELDLLQESPKFQLACLIGLISIHKSSKSNDNTIVSSLESKLRDKRKTAEDESLYFAGLFWSAIGKPDKAKEYVDRVLRVTDSGVRKDALLCRGWIEIELCGQLSQDQANTLLTYFGDENRFNDPEQVLGKAKVLQKSGNFKKAIELLDQSLSLFPLYLPIYLERMKFEVACKDWDRVLETCSKALSLERYCIEANRHLILYYLVWDYNEQQVYAKFSDLINSLELREPKNAHLYHETARIFSSITYENKEILAYTMSLAERAAFLEPNSSKFQCELGFQNLQLNKIADAERHFKNSTRLNENDLLGIIGSLRVALIERKKDIFEQVAALEELHSLEDMPMETLFLCALASDQQNKSRTEVFKFLNFIVEKHLNALKKLPVGLEFYSKLNVSQIITIVKLYLKHTKSNEQYLNTSWNKMSRLSVGGSSPNSAIVTGGAVASQAEKYLQPILASCPGLAEAYFLMAKIKMNAGDATSGLCLIDKCIQRNGSFGDALLLKAQICVSQRKTQMAIQALESALSHDFQIREQPLYTLVQARTLALQRKFDEAIALLDERQHSTAGSRRKKNALTESERFTFDLLTLDLLINADKQKDAKELIDELHRKYGGQPKALRELMLAKAHLLESVGQIGQAINVLNDTRFERNAFDDADESFAFYVQTRRKLAHLYLTYWKDQKQYAKCFHEILAQNASIESHLMLGDAYMIILEPDKAIEIYESALKKNPKDAFLTRKVGQAYIKAHLYEKAITYYKAAIKSSLTSNELRYDLAQLLFQMKRHEDAAEVTKSALESITEDSSGDLDVLEFESKMTHLQGNIWLQLNKKEAAISSFRRSHSIQNKVLRRLPIEKPDLIQHHKRFALEICTQFANLVSDFHQNHRQAILIYKEFVDYENNATIVSNMARLEMQGGDLEQANRYCTLLMKISPDNEQSLLLMADLLFCKNEFDNALPHFQRLLDRRPNNYDALARLIEASRRAGRLLELVPTYLQQAESSTGQPHPSLLYCRALFHLHSGRPEVAIKLFSVARRERSLQASCLLRLIEICVHLDSGVLPSDASGDTSNVISGAPQPSAIETAERFLSELKESELLPDSIEFQVISSWITIARKQKSALDLVVANLSRLLTDEQTSEHVGLSFSLSCAYATQKQFAKARTCLKRAAKAIWTYKEAEYLEKSWLLLADIYVQSGKHDPANELLQRTLLYNKSSIRAHEYLGYVAEKEQMYDDARHHLEQAWRLCDQSNPMIGFRLAFNYMKNRLFVEAIDVCHRIMAINPDFPRLRHEILDKCKLSIR